jgi:hypothetical protein
LKRNQSGDRRLKKKNITLKKAMMPDKSNSSSGSPLRVPQTIACTNAPQEVVFGEQFYSILREVLEHTADEDFIEKHELEENPLGMALSGGKLMFDHEHAFNLSKSSLLDSFQSCEEPFDCNLLSVSELLEPRPIEEMMHDRPFCTEEVQKKWYGGNVSAF